MFFRIFRCCLCAAHVAFQQPSTATADGDALSAAVIADKLPEPSDYPTGRQFAAAPIFGHVDKSRLTEIETRARDTPVGHSIHGLACRYPVRKCCASGQVPPAKRPASSR